MTVLSPTAEEARRVRTVYERAGLASLLDSRVTNQLPHDDRFGVALSFNALPLAHDWREHLARQLSVATEAFVFVTHASSWGALLCRVRDRLRGPRREALYAHESTRTPILEGEMRRRGHIVDRAWVDAPWWPDLFVETGETLWSGTVGRAVASTASAAPFTYGPESWPFTSSDRPAELDRALRRHPTFDRGPDWIAPTFAHHRAYRLRPKL